MTQRYIIGRPPVEDGQGGNARVFGSVDTDDQLRVTLGAGVDADTTSLVTIDVPHHEIHEGEMFTANAVDATLANGETLVVHILAGSKESHMMFAASCPLSFYAQFYEAPTLTGNGTPVAVYKRNRNDTTHTPTSTVFTAPTYSAPGTLMESYYVGTGKTSGGESRSDHEWILAHDVSYLIVVTSGANANSGSVVLNWYEE